MTRKAIGLIFAPLFVLLGTALAAPLLAQPAPPSAAKRPPLPWDPDVAMFVAAQPELQKASIRALAGHVADFEAALKHGAQFFPDGVVVDGRRYVLADGHLESLAVALKGAIGDPKDPAHLPVSVVPNVYPVIAMELGSYYNEMDRQEDGIRVLDQGLQLSPYPKEGLGAHVAEMIGEKGFALGSEKKLDEALATYQDGLKLKGVEPHDRARLERGEGYVLTEMNRLDDAEAAYKASLDDEPNNQRALNELSYIAKLKAGGPKTPTESVLVPRPEEPAK